MGYFEPACDLISVVAFRTTEAYLGDNMARPGWDEYFMEITHLVAKRSTCLRRQVGAVLVKDKNILATGYNGAPSGVAHCLDVGCLRERLEIPSGQRHELLARRPAQGKTWRD